MPEPAFDAPDSSPPLPPAPPAVGKGDSPAAGGARSFDDLTGGSDAQYDAITKADLSLTKQKIGAEAGMEAQRKRSDDAYAQRQERLIAAEGATMDDIKPWNAEKELNDRKTNLWEQFGSPGFVIAMLASSFSGMPMNSALNAGAAAMNAINEGDMDKYHKAFDAWKENSNLTLKRLDLEEHQFGQIDDLRSKNMESWRTAATALATRFNDQRMLALLQNGMDGPALEARDALAKSKIELAQSREFLMQNDLRMKLINADPDYKSGDPKKMAAAIHRADDAMRNEDTLKLTPDQSFTYHWWKEHPEGTSSEFSDAYDKYKSGQFTGRGLGLAAQNLPAAVQEWTDVLGAQPSQAIMSMLDSAYSTKGQAGAVRIGQIQTALNDIRTRKANGEDIDVHAAEKIVADAASQPTSMATAAGPEKLAELGWSPRAIDAAAETYNETGKFPSNLGTRQYAGIISGKIQDRAAEMLEEKGQTIEDRARNWQQYHTQQVAQNRFLSGPQGNTIRSLNVVVSHLQVLQDLSTALKNGNIDRFNAISQRWAEETGKEAPTDFDTAKRIVGAEIIKALGVAGAGTEAERSEAADSFTKARSPSQISGSIKTAQKLLVGQLSGLKKQFVTSTGLPAGTFDNMLEPQTRAFLGDMAPTSNPKPSSVLVGPNTQNDPDGTTYKKDGWLWKKDGGKIVPMKPLSGDQ
jgi:hypothetical protein